MNVFKLIITMGIVVLTGCGGGAAEVAATSSPAAVASQATPPGPGLPTPPGAVIQAEVDYRFNSPDLYPNGVVDVYPTSGRTALSDAATLKVDLLLFGEDMQTLTRSNFQPKDAPQPHFVFTVPNTFKAGAYPCGTGMYVSEVRITDVNGVILAKQFELCPGTPAHFTYSN